MRDLMRKEYARYRQPSNDNLIWRMCFACCITKATDTHTLRICNTCCFSTATMVTLRRPFVTLCPHCLSSYIPLSFKGLTVSELAVIVNGSEPLLCCFYFPHTDFILLQTVVIFPSVLRSKWRYVNQQYFGTSGCSWRVLSIFGLI